jgi:uncharacterized coiled-coil protein SlyX
MDDLIGKTKHEIEDILNARAPDCPPEVSGEEARRLAARIAELEAQLAVQQTGLNAMNARLWELIGERDRLSAMLKEAEEAAKKIAAECPAIEPPPAYDDWGDQIADTDERHAERVTALRLWELGKIARDLLARLEAREEVSA